MITLRDAKSEDLQNCMRCLANSLLADNYFRDTSILQATISDAILKKEVQVVSLHKEAVGLLRINYEGMFGQFPYLRLLAIREEYRNKGIGGTAFTYFEKTGFARSRRLFLCVSDFNEGGRRFYEKRGFRETARIENLFKKGIAELIMVKDILA